MAVGHIRSEIFRSDILAVVKQARQRNHRSVLYMALGLTAALFSLAYCGAFDSRHYSGAFERFLVVTGEAFPPDFSRWRSWILPLFETLAMSLASSVISTVVALFLSLFVARNLAPVGVVSATLRGAFNLLRSVPELVLGIVLVITLGFGALAGILALSLHSVGMLGKFFSELIEHADPGPIEALRAQGASTSQVFCFGVLPQVLPRIVDLALYRWEHNFRASTVIGLVGAGGIGFELIAAVRLFEYREAFALLILTLVLVTIIDFVGGVLRKRFVED